MKLHILGVFIAAISNKNIFETCAFVQSPSSCSRATLNNQSPFSIASQKGRQKPYRSVSLFLEPLAKEGDWAAYVDEGNTDDIFYFNEITGESRWDPPTKTFPTVEQTIDFGLSEDIEIPSKKKVLAREGSWAAYVDEEVSGMIYYFNTMTGESVWEPPTKTFPKIKMTKKEKEKMMAKRRAYAETLKATDDMPTETKGGFLSSFMQGFKAPENENKVEQKDVTPMKEEKKEITTESINGSTGTETKASQGIFGFLGKSKQAEAESTDDKVETEEKEKPKDAKEGAKFGFNLFGGTQEKTEASDVKVETKEKEEVKPQVSKIVSSKPKVTKVEKQEPKVEIQTEPDVEEEEKEESPSIVSNFMNFFNTAPTEEVAETEEFDEFEDDDFVPVTKPVKLEVAAKVLAHPDKVSWGGEDALFTAGRNFGIFDGVSGAEKEDGVPLYSVTLAQQMRKKIGTKAVNIDEITGKMLEAAEYADVSATGASTSLVASIGEDGFLRVLNVGDCALIVIRDGQVSSRSKEITHFFDCPYQLSLDSPDRPIDGTVLQVEVIPGDIIVAGSDGIFDNVGDELLIDTINSAGAKAQIICKNIVNVARKVSLDPLAATPYARLASKKGYPQYGDGLGGKLDDISCVVVKVK